jgi:hypothetical protein
MTGLTTETSVDGVAEGRGLPTLIRAALHRKALADARQRAALARRLGLTDSKVLAVQHLARAGELTPGQLGALLQLSRSRSHRSCSGCRRWA